jgi:hypothetical protein
MTNWKKAGTRSFGGNLSPVLTIGITVACPPSPLFPPGHSVPPGGKWGIEWAWAAAGIVSACAPVGHRGPQGTTAEMPLRAQIFLRIWGLGVRVSSGAPKILPLLWRLGGWVAGGPACAAEWGLDLVMQ